MYDLLASISSLYQQAAEGKDPKKENKVRTNDGSMQTIQKGVQSRKLPRDKGRKERA